MIDRRVAIAGAVALAATRAARATPPMSAKARAIDAIALPPHFNGTLACGRDGRVEHIRCVGQADVEASKAVTPATQFRWGSVSKWLTSVAALRLVERDQLSLEAPITAYLPLFRRDTGQRVLLKHLLSNTSGIPDLLSRQIAQEPELRVSTATAADMVARFGGGDLAFAPGAGWDYAALNWVIVAAILERVTGEVLPDIVRRLAMRPLGMTTAGFAQMGRPAMADLAAAYADVAPPVRKISPAPSFAAATGNVAGSVRDAMRAASGVFNGALLRPESLRELTHVRWQEEDYALGGRVRPIGGELWAWETGKIGGYRTHIAHRLGGSETVVIFNTTDLDQSVIGAWVETIARA